MALSWKSQQFQKLIENIFPPSVSGCVLTPEGAPLHLQYAHLADIGTLPLAGRITNQYLQLQPGQVAIMNDPYSGGTLLSTVTLVTGVALTGRAPQKTDAILAYRFPLRPHLKFAGTVDEEGLRIPPTPIADGDNINKSLLKIMAEHPLAPQSLYERTIAAIAELHSISQQFREGFDIYDLNFSKSLVQNYLAESHKVMKSMLSELPLGDSRVQSTLKDETRIRVHIELTGEKVLMDFTGTSASPAMNLTDAATFG
ncbi:MAG TPA: hydantoinase B/oxoprolinase family protein, partial [Bdellovibrionales bacterium]|nr:hydantoinase B/oxoprolinase family protein [Bdellovibrionales bacterium]